MSTDCSCFRDFPPREFKTARAADDFMSGVRMAATFRFVGTEEGPVMREKYRCRTCGRDWVCRVPADPPYAWGPVVGVAAPAAPRDGIPEATPVDAPPAEPLFLEVDGLKRERIGEFSVAYEEEAVGEVPGVMRTLLAWKPGLRSWAANAGLVEVEIQIGPRLEKGARLSDVFATAWEANRINPAWKAVKAGRQYRPVHVRGVREHLAGGGFRGEYFLVVVDLRTESVIAWMARDAGAGR